MVNIDTEEWLEERRKSQQEFLRTNRISSVISRFEKPILKEEESILKTEKNISRTEKDISKAERNISKAEKEVEKRILELENTVFKILEKLNVIESEIKKKYTFDIFKIWKTLSTYDKIRFLMYLGVPKQFALQYAKEM